jgi:hypothetical protein
MERTWLGTYDATVGHKIALKKILPFGKEQDETDRLKTIYFIVPSTLTVGMATILRIIPAIPKTMIANKEKEKAVTCCSTKRCASP